METETQIVRDDANVVSDNVVNENQTKENNVSYDAHRKLLNQRKKDQSELDDLRNWKRDQELAKQEADGNYIEVNNALREENKKIKADFKETTQKVAFGKFESQCVGMAKELGCSDTESLMMYMNKDRMASVQTDEKLNANNDDLTRVINEIKELKPNLFTGGAINHNPVTMTGFKKAVPQQLSDMSKQDIINQLRSL